MAGKRQFGPENCAAVIARLEVGLSFHDAAEGAGIKLSTAQAWRARGKREDSGPYHDFTVAVEQALARKNLPIEPMTPEEHRAKVSEVARKGNVAALKLYWEMICKDNAGDENATETQPLAGVDELAERARRRFAA